MSDDFSRHDSRRNRERTFSPQRGGFESTIHRSDDEERAKENRSKYGNGEEVGNPGNVLFIAALSPMTREHQLLEAFEKHGRVTDCKLLFDPETRESRCFGFITMENKAAAEKAISALNGVEMDGKNIMVEISKRGRPRTPTPGRYMGTGKQRARFDRQRHEPYQRHDNHQMRGGSNFVRHDDRHDSYESRAGGSERDYGNRDNRRDQPRYDNRSYDSHGPVDRYNGSRGNRYDQPPPPPRSYNDRPPRYQPQEDMAGGRYDSKRAPRFDQGSSRYEDQPTQSYQTPHQNYRQSRYSEQDRSGKRYDQQERRYDHPPAPYHSRG